MAGAPEPGASGQTSSKQITLVQHSEGWEAGSPRVTAQNRTLVLRGQPGRLHEEVLVPGLEGRGGRLPDKERAEQVERLREPGDLHA